MYKKSLSMFAVLLLGSFSVMAWAGDGKDKKGATALQGSWKASDAVKGDSRITFDGNKFTVEFKDEKATGTFTTDASKTPKTIDMLITGGTAKIGEKYKGKTSLGIYAVEGNKLKWCANEPGADARPTAFPDKDSPTKMLYIVFDREKK